MIHAGSSGEIVFQNVPAGEHRVRVIAGRRDAAIRSRVILMPDSPTFCSLNAINRGITKHYINSTVAYYTIEWRPIGDDVGFLCDFGVPEYYAEKCLLCYFISGNVKVLATPFVHIAGSSPFTFPAEEGVTRVKVLPDPNKCRGTRKPYVFHLDPGCN